MDNKVIILDSQTAILALDGITERAASDMIARLADISPDWTFVVLPWEVELLDLRGDPSLAALARELGNRIAKGGLKLVQPE